MHDLPSLLAPWPWLSTQQSHRITLWEYYGNNIRLPKRYDMAGGQPGDKWSGPLAEHTAGYPFPPPRNNNQHWYSNQSNFKPDSCCPSYTLKRNTHTKAHEGHVNILPQKNTQWHRRKEKRTKRDKLHTIHHQTENQVSVWAFCKTKAPNESGWESHDPTEFTCSQPLHEALWQAFCCRMTHLSPRHFHPFQWP